MKAVEHKKEREVKYTDRVPPPKRTRTGCTGFNYILPPLFRHSRCLFHPGNTKTLFQKTRTDASKLQKNIYNARILPPMPTSKNYGQVAPQMALEPSSSRVTVNTVIKRHLNSAPLTIRSVTSETTSLSAQSASSSATSPTPQPLITTSPISISSSPPIATLMTASKSPWTAKSPTPNKTIKKDPMATLFVPKRKAYSQRPV
jgi:elongin-A